MEKTAKSILSEKSKLRIGKLANSFPQAKSIVLPILHIINDQFGFLNIDALKEAAELSGVEGIFFEEAANFYTMFPQKPVGKYLIQVCHNISCTLLGAESLLEYLKENLKIDVGGTTADRQFSLVAVECLGSCGMAPVMQINDTYYENLTKAVVDEILEKLRNKA